MTRSILKKKNWPKTFLYLSLSLLRSDPKYFINVTSSAELTVTWNFTLFVRNSNTKLNLYYDRLKASVSYGRDDILSTTLLQPFFQPKRNETRVLVWLSVVDEYVGSDEDFWRES